MEKYSKFRDEATGIAPFQPPKSPSDDFNFVQIALIYIVGLINLAILIPTVIVYTLFLSWLPFGIDRLLLRTVVLWTLRLYYINYTYEGEKKVSVRRNQVVRAGAGDIIISTFVSPLDPVLYATQNKCTFVFPASGKFKTESLCGAIARALSLPSKTEGESMDKIVERAKKSGSLIILFAEGTTSNGRGYLTTSGVDFRSVASGSNNVFCGVTRYTPPSATSPLPQSSLGYIWRLLISSWWYMASVKVSREPLAKSLITDDGVSKAITGLARIRKIGNKLDAEAKKLYVEALKVNGKKSRR